MSNEKLQPYETKMQKSLDALEREYTTIRAGRANPHPYENTCPSEAPEWS